MNYRQQKPKYSIKDGKMIPYEELECFDFTKWLSMNAIMFTHIPNENTIKNINFITKMKRMGVNKGVPDYLIKLSKDKCSLETDILLFVEMKRIDKNLSKISKEQKTWLFELEKIAGVFVCIAYGSEEAKKFVKKYFKKEKLKYNF